MSKQSVEHYRWPITGLVLIALIYILYAWVRLVIPVELIEVRKAFNLEMSSAGFLASVSTLGIAITAIPFGFFVVKYGTRYSLFVGAIIFSVGIAWPPFGFGLGDLIGAQVLSGMGEGLYNIALYSFIGGLSVKYRGTITGIAASIFGIGIFTGPLAISRIMTYTSDWKAAFIWFALAGIVGGFLILFALRNYDIKSERRTGSITIERLQRVLTSRNIALCVVGALNGLAMYSFTSLFATYLRTAHGMDVTTASGLLSFFGIGFICGGAPAGYLADKIGRKLYLVIALIICGASGCLAFMVPPVYWLLALFAFSYGFGENSAYANSYALIQDQVEKPEIPIATGVLATIYFVMGAVSGYVVVTLRDAFGWGVASIIIFAVAYGIAALIMVGMMVAGRPTAVAQVPKAVG